MTAAALSAGPDLEAIPGIGLDQLVAEAALLTRVDRKYVVPAAALPDLVADFASLEPRIHVLEIGQRKQHRYGSTYFDTPDLDAYFGAARRRRHRFKVRTREYVDTDARFTEVKTSGRRGATVKTRTPRLLGAAVLTDDDAGFVRTELDRTGHAGIDVSALVPVLRTSYARSTLWLPSCAARVTIDTDLTWSLAWTDRATRVPRLAVVETKCASAATGVDRVLWRRGHRPSRISKYGAGMALLLEDLPSHRWRRVLDTHLRPHATTHPLLGAIS
ncbi:polyphosphate polymerase domain-containing protein [Nocardioides stalactiti]|uniref:polyphosphate polymerase domain-containing protein n=1 Tax=Nocardioides stalactiti TaxID=2755356 RepID=UPI0016045623|nr:polyphosphate polymerase domain-containing protein [Nocardioides stalactiti]